MSERIVEHAEYCKVCGSARRRTVDMSTRRYILDLPSQCLRKDECERELMRDFTYEREDSRHGS